MKNRIAVYVRWLLVVVFLLAAGCFYCGSSEKPGTLILDSVESVSEKASAAETAGMSGGSAVDGSLAAEDESSVAEAETVPVQAETAETFCYVHVCGEVVNPGVYKLSEGSRIYEAVELAGGFTERAARDFVNLAEPVSDGMKVGIPDEEHAGELVSSDGVTVPDSLAAAKASAQKAKVNINRADRAALMTLKGIGEARAEAILQYREEHGSFAAIEDIMQVPGIKDAAFQKIKDDIMV